MQEHKQYTSHLCTFMGREANLKILIPYVDKALEIGAVDNYWFIDMTRKRSDHELIKKLSSELNDKYPGRVHLYNSEERGKIIDDKENLAEATKSWETFYKFLKRFNDNDIIAKCDDDTYYIDVETLKAAYEFRWNNKKPYLMHGNAINNGLTAYHANKKGIWKDKESSMYPSGGLTGPLFSHPDIACKHHDQFTRDMIANRDNINKYKLGKNIQFCNRVSINFIFMLGKDRRELSKITYQDEYDTSSKYPQRENRPNVIIGDFTMAHHTYGVQEPIMEELKTHIGYEKLGEKLNSGDIKFEHKSINTDLNATTTIAVGGKMLARAPVEQNSFVIKNPETDEYLSLHNDLLDNTNQPMLKTFLGRTKDIKDAVVLNADLNSSSCIQVNNSMLIFRLADKPDGLMVLSPKFFRGQYKQNVFNFIKCPNGRFLIKGNDGTYLAPLYPPENMRENNLENYEKMYRFCKFQEEKFEWIIQPLGKYNNTVIATTLKRPSNFTRVANDETTAKTFIDDLPHNNCPREWIWMVKDYVWEMIPTPKENIFKIKLVADDKPDMYLFYHPVQDKLITGGGGDEFEFVDKAPKYLKNVKSGKYVNITDDGEVVLQTNFVELAMCPLK